MKKQNMLLHQNTPDVSPVKEGLQPHWNTWVLWAELVCCVPIVQVDTQGQAKLYNLSLPWMFTGEGEGGEDNLLLHHQILGLPLVIPLAPDYKVLCQFSVSSVVPIGDEAYSSRVYRELLQEAALWVISEGWGVEGEQERSQNGQADWSVCEVV